MEHQIAIVDQPGRAYPNTVGRMHKPPTQLFYRGELESLIARPRVAIVGSRRISAYGRQVTWRLAEQLAEQGVVIISGLAIGVDSCAHEAALAAGGLTIAVLPSPVDAVAPATNYQLSQRIIEGGGGIVSTYPSGSTNHKGNFVARNELVAALSDVVIITEAAARSGSHHTAEFAHSMGVSVMAAPGPITSPLSEGTNNLLRTPQAHVVTDVRDVLRLLNLDTPNTNKPRGRNAAEQQVLDLLVTGLHDGDDILNASTLTPEQFNQTITMLELTAKILPLGGNQWSLA